MQTVRQSDEHTEKRREEEGGREIDKARDRNRCRQSDSQTNIQREKRRREGGREIDKARDRNRCRQSDSQTNIQREKDSRRDRERGRQRDR